MWTRRTANPQRGVVLLLALVALLLIAAVGAAILYMAESESGFVGSQKMTARAFYADMAGLEEARYRMMPIISDSQGGVSNLDVLNPADNTQAFAQLPVIPGPGVAPPDVLYIINTANPASPANFDAAALAPGSNPAQPASANNDPLRAPELPGAATIRAVATIQPGAGTPASIGWNWVRINIKTERASGQDLNLNASTIDDDPVFVYQTRQYRATDLAAMNVTVLPPPWGPNPLLQPVPILDRPCVALICSSPVYMLTAFTIIPGVKTTSRLVRAEVAVSPAFSLNAAIVSQPAINVTGTQDISGRDICDPDCAFLASGAGPLNLFAGQAQFKPRPETDVPAACTYFLPLKSETPGSPPNDPGPSSAVSDPVCNPAVNPACSCGANSCVETGVPPQYNINELINAFRPRAVTLRPPVNSYYPQVGLSNLACDAAGNCQGQGVEFGGFPFTNPLTQTGPDPVNGTNADPIVTYVPGNLKCTSSCTGAGTLIVDGDLELNASMAFYGTIIVRGNVSVLGGGSPPTPCNIYGGLLSGGAVETQIGGSICFQYNSCAQRDQSSNIPLLSISFREIPQ